MYCHKCKKLVDVHGCHREKRVLPELKPEFDLVTWCCSVCGEPIIKVTEFQRVKEKE
jgi:hypothetical protein